MKIQSFNIRYSPYFKQQKESSINSSVDKTIFNDDNQHNDEYEMFVSKMNHSLSVFSKIYSDTLKVKDLNPNSEVFNIIRKDYPKFDNWLKKVSERTVYTIKNSDTNELVGMLIPKLEARDEIDCIPKIESNKVMKLCSMVIDPNYRRANLGMFLMLLALDYASENSIDDIYFTRYPKDNDNVVAFFEQYGFKKYGINSNGENVYLRHIDKTSDNFHYFSLLNPPKNRLSETTVKRIMKDWFGII